MKQVLLIRTDIDISRGKAVAQGAHAAVNAVERADEEAVEQWNTGGHAKIALAVDSQSTLEELIEEARDEDLPTSLVRDLGRTEIDSGTVTAGAIGPAQPEVIDDITGHLSLY